MLFELATGRDLARSAVGGPVAAALDGHLPEQVSERRGTPTFDTPENRFILAFLEEADRICRAMADHAGRLGESLQGRIRGDVTWMRERLRVFARHGLWDSVGRMTVAPLGSTVMQRRRGYRDVYRHSVRLRLASTALPISQHQARDLLESKDIATLYEVWSYFKVVEIASAILGAPHAARWVTYNEVAAHLQRGFEVKWPSGVCIAYNAEFRRNKHRRSYSLPMRPDVSVFVRDEIHLLDAKFRVVLGNEDDEQVDFKADDVWKMHGYRDAIPSARSAWVLYPGTIRKEYLRDGSGSDGVGAIPLQPGDRDCVGLRGVLSRLLIGAE